MCLDNERATVSVGVKHCSFRMQEQMLDDCLLQCLIFMIRELSCKGGVAFSFTGPPDSAKVGNYFSMNFDVMQV